MGTYSQYIQVEHEIHDPTQYVKMVNLCVVIS